MAQEGIVLVRLDLHGGGVDRVRVDTSAGNRMEETGGQAREAFESACEALARLRRA
jgi:hypothetical protein